MSEARERLATLRKEIEERRKEIQEKAQELFKRESGAIFERHPQLNAFRWHQYTPFFNDGEPCVFRTNTDYFDLDFTAAAAVVTADAGAEVDEDEGDEPEGNWRQVDDYDFRAPDPDSPLEYKREGGELYGDSALRAAWADIKGLLEIFDEDDFEQMFGDHVEVTVRRGGIEVDEYHHD